MGLQLPFMDVSQAKLTNLVEENLKPLEVSEGTVVPIGPFGIATVRVL